ncbi:MAG: hypothetical protein ACK4HR_06395 [Hyphomonas sp.]|jgi:hypothetical protein
MPSPRLSLAAAATTLALAGCQYLPWHKPKAEAPALAPQAETVTAEEAAIIVESAPETCDVLESRDWAAWVNLMPGPDATPTLHVTGKVDVRTGGYTFDWQTGPLDRSATPKLRLKLIPRAPDGMATMAITTEEVNYAAPAGGIEYSGVLVSCGSVTLADIAEITRAY